MILSFINTKSLYHKDCKRQYKIVNSQKIYILHNQMINRVTLKRIYYIAEAFASLGEIFEGVEACAGRGEKNAASRF